MRRVQADAASLTAGRWFGLLMAVTATVALLIAPASAQARHGRISLSVASSANVGASVLVSGTVAGRARGRRVVLQARSGRRWRVLAAGRVSHRRFRMAFSAPSVPRVLTIRAVVYRGSRRVLVSGLRRVTVLGYPARPTPVQTISRVTGWGNNSHSQLGGGYRDGYSSVPVSAPSLSGVEAVAATYFSSYVLQAGGIVQAWGGNLFGELGDGLTSALSIANPAPVVDLGGVSAIAAGGAHAMALLDNGTVATWGGNLYGQLGNGTTGEGRAPAPSPVPIIVPGLTNVVAVAAGGAVDAALLSDGTVLAWGENKHGQLGDGTTTEKDVPTPVRGLSGVRAIAVGGVPSDGAHMLALLSNGTVMAIGDNRFGELGDGSSALFSASPVPVKGLTGVKAISAGFNQSMALLENGTVITWGSNKFGQLGIGSAHEVCGEVSCSRVPVPVGLSNVTGIAAGFNFSLALSGGSVFACGLNNYGQLGDGSTSDSSVPVPVSGINHVAAISAGEYHSLALIHEPGPATSIEVSAGVGRLTVSWRTSETGEPWTLSWREATRPTPPWGSQVHLASSARSYTITGLAARPYEVSVQNKSFGKRVVTSTPLP